MSVYRVGTNKSSTNVFPSIRPTLDLDFANTKTLDPRITFTRASGGTYVGADGLIKYAGVNEARFDHDPETGESLGLLIEEARTNIFQRSEEFDDSYWSNNGVNINQDSIQAPDGSFTADAIIEENNSLDKRIARNPSMTVGNRHTLSVYAKIIPNSNQRYLMLVFNSGFSSVSGANFDLVTGKVGATFSSSAFMIPLSNGWYRCIMTPNGDSIGGGSMRFRISSVNTTGAIGNPGANTYQGDGVSGFYLWGAQLEVGSFPTSYIPTQASTRTRALDNASITGKNFSDFYNQSEGSVTIKAKTNILPDFLTNRFPYSMQIDNGPGGLSNFSIDNGVLTNGAIRQIFAARNNGVTISAGMGNNLSYNGLTCSFAYKTDDLAFINGGGTLFTKGDAPIPTNMVRLLIGTGNGGLIRGTVSKLTYYPKRLPNQQLRALTR
jgi:hypothetical protein